MTMRRLTAVSWPCWLMRWAWTPQGRIGSQGAQAGLGGQGTRAGDMGSEDPASQAPYL